MNPLLAWRHIRAAAIIVAVLVYAPCAMAHKTSYGYLKADFSGDAVSGKLELALRDFDFAFFDFTFGPGANGGGKVSWDQLHRHENEIAGLLLNKISIGPPGAHPGSIGLDTLGGEYYIVLPFSGPCKTTGGPSQVRYDLMFDIDPQHRGLIDVRRDNDVYSGVITPETKVLQFRTGTKNLRDTILAYVHQGAHHIWIGYDHILFLVTLLLPAVLTRMKNKWPAFWGIAKVVTAFTLAHSVTLSVAAFGIIELPSRYRTRDRRIRHGGRNQQHLPHHHAPPMGRRRSG